MPTQIIYNARIATLDDAHGFAGAIAVRGERVLAVGGDDEIRALAARGTQQLDAEGRLLIPGLTDAHLHFSMFSEFLRNIDAEQPSKQAVLDLVAERVATLPPGEWITGHGWRQDDWHADGAFPTAADLDAIAPNHPVSLRAKSGHAVWANSAALKLANVTANTPDPGGGKIGRDAHGRPSGILFETAEKLVRDVIPATGGEALMDMMREAMAYAHRAGLTGIHDFDGYDAFYAFQRLRERGELGLRVVKNIPLALAEHALALGIRSGFGDHWLRLGNVKVSMDGALGPRTAAMLAPYDGEPDNYGIVVTDKEDLYEVASRATAQGLSMTVHAIGDRANHDLLDVYAMLRKEEAARGVTPAQRRHRVEHVQILHPDDLQRLGQLQLVASMQPLHATSDITMAERYWSGRHRYAYTFRTQLEAGAVLAFGSDAPVESINPFTGIHAAVTSRRADGSPGPEGWHAEQRLTVDEALRAYTSGAAWAAYAEDDLGSLSPGKLADLIILDRDLYTCDPMAIRDTRVLGTMIGGVWMYRAV